MRWRGLPGVPVGLSLPRVLCAFLLPLTPACPSVAAPLVLPVVVTRSQ